MMLLYKFIPTLHREALTDMSNEKYMCSIIWTATM